jgi:hypothetical protein
MQGQGTARTLWAIVRIIGCMGLDVMNGTGKTKGVTAFGDARTRKGIEADGAAFLGGGGKVLDHAYRLPGDW